jgi:hypothetical protein
VIPAEVTIVFSPSLYFLDFSLWLAKVGFPVWLFQLDHVRETVERGE